MLEAEMDEPLGYEKHNNIGDHTGNSRNGYNKKTIISDYGESEIAVPRDRNGEFEPKVLEKRQVRTDEIEQKIMAMYSKGMSQRDIEDNLREIYGAEIPQTLISKITDKILPEVNEWQNRPLEPIYPIIYFDGIVFKSRKDNQIINKCVYSVLGIDMNGQNVNLDDAEYAREEFREKWDRKYPSILRSWDANWTDLTTFFEFPEEIRHLIYTTNAVEAYHRMESATCGELRKFTKAKAIFPTDDSIRKVVFLSVKEIAKKWTLPARDWAYAYSQIMIFFADRFAA